MAFRNSIQSGEILQNLNALAALPQTIRALNPKTPEQTTSQDVATNLQGTDKQVPFTPSAETVNGAYYLNLPRPEEGLLAKMIFFDLIKEIEDYQLDKRNVWFKEHYDLVIDANKANGIIADATLRDNYEIFAQRFAERAAAYIMEKMNQCGAYLNIESTSRLLKGVWSSIAADFRLAYRNNFLNQYGSSPEPIVNGKGLTKMMADYMKMAVGFTAYNARVICIPLIDHTAWGNRYQHMIRPEDLFLTKNDGTVVPIDPTQLTGFDDAFQLLKHIGESAENMGSSHTNGITYESMPYCDNIGTLFATDNDSVSVRASAHADRTMFAQEGIAPNGSKLSNKDNLTGRLWMNYFIVDKRLRTQYPEYFNANDQGVRWLIDHKYLQVCPSHSEMHAYMGAVANTPITDLLSKMTYKKDNQANTATIVEYYVKATDADGRNDSTQALITQNFEKYDLATQDAAQIIRKMKQYPGNAPRIFANVEKGLNLVVNSVSNLTPNTVTKTAQSGTPVADYELHATVYGADATLYDYGLISSLDAMNSEYEFAGLTAESAKSLIEYDSTTQPVIFKECPDTTFVLQKPIIDTSDLTKCGFDVMLSKETQMRDEWFGFVGRKNKFTDESSWNNEYPTYGQVLGTGYFALDLCMLSEALDKPGKRCHPVVSDYLELQKHCFFFVGAGILQHPATIHANAKAGFYFSRQNIPMWHNNGAAATFKFVKDIVDIQSSPADEVIQRLKQLWWYATDTDVKNDESDELSNIMLAGILEGGIDEKGNYTQTDLFIFDPSFNPVLPAIDGIGLADFNPMVLPMLNESRDLYYDKSDGFKFQAGRFQLGGGSGMTGRTHLSEHDVNAWDSKANDHQYATWANILPWVSKFKVPVAQYDPDFRSLQFTLDGDSKRCYSGDRLWYLHIINKAIIKPADSSHLIGFMDAKGDEFVKQPTIDGIDKLTAAEDEMKKKMLTNISNPDNTTTEGGSHGKENSRQNQSNRENGSDKSERRNHRSRRRGNNNRHQGHTNRGSDGNPGDSSKGNHDSQSPQKPFQDRVGVDADTNGDGKETTGERISNRGPYTPDPKVMTNPDDQRHQ